jgi:hypothetical protein
MRIFSSFLSRKSVKQRIEEDLLKHFDSIGITASQKNWIAESLHRREGDEKVILQKLASLSVKLNNIVSIEVWREKRKHGHISTTQDELVYKIPFRNGITLRRIPVLTNMSIVHTADKNNLEWTGFTWGKLPLLVERLQADNELNNKLHKIYEENMLCELRIRALSDDNVDIVSEYNPQRLPPRELITCVEAIAKHVISYVNEQNKARDHVDEIVRQKLFGPGS